MKAPRALSVIYCFPRSGGTLLNQCLLCDERNVVLSEVNPAGSVLPPPQQACTWFGLLAPDEAAKVQREPYIAQIHAIERSATRRGKLLCIRDWTGINFLAHISPWHGLPSQVLEQQVYLQAAGYELREIAFVRRSRGVYRSLRENIVQLRAMDVETFAASYRAYLLAIAQVPKFTMEQFVSHQQATLESICRALGLHFPSDFAERFHSIATVTGNNTLPEPPASAGWKKIEAPRVPRGAPKLQEPLFDELDRLAGYPEETAP